MGPLYCGISILTSRPNGNRRFGRADQMGVDVMGVDALGVDVMALILYAITLRHRHE